MVGMQFDDANNQFPMNRFFVLDAMASRSIGAGVEIFASAENLFNEKYLFALQGVPELGLPIAARFGVRVQIPQALDSAREFKMGSSRSVASIR